MRRIFVLLLTITVLTNSWGQSVSFKFSDGIYNETLKSNVERNISALLTNINKASRQKAKNVSMTGVRMVPQALSAFNDLWEFMPFCCDDQMNVERCIQTVTGYQVRGIPVTVTDKSELDGQPERELTVGFNSSGDITGVYFALEQHNISNILQHGQEVKDVRQREEILNFVERYRSYYDQKDLKSIEDIFSDDAIIITGKEIKRKTPEGGMFTITEYKEQNKQQYINMLRGIFRRNSFVKVTFKGAEVVRHPVRKDVYMVTLHQNWRTPGYEDNGYVVLLWQFPENGGDPRIMVRTWQSDKVVKTKEDVFQLEDFKIN